MTDGDVDEWYRVQKMDPYRAVKVDIEQEHRKLSQNQGLDVILQTTVLYGAQGRTWTDSPVRDLLVGSVVLPNKGNGSAIGALFFVMQCACAMNCRPKLSSGQRARWVGQLIMVRTEDAGTLTL